MGSLDAFARDAGIPVRHAGGLMLIRHSDALSLVDALAAAGVRILGLEGFDVEGSYVRSDMGLIADFSDVVEPSESATAARRFIEATTRPDVFFEFSIAEERSR